MYHVLDNVIHRGRIFIDVSGTRTIEMDNSVIKLMFGTTIGTIVVKGQKMNLKGIREPKN